MYMQLTCIHVKTLTLCSIRQMHTSNFTFICLQCLPLMHVFTSVRTFQAVMKELLNILKTEFGAIAFEHLLHDGKHARAIGSA